MSEDVRRLVGRNVNRLRIAVGTRAELAERMGVDRPYVSGLELGQLTLTIVTLWHIAKAVFRGRVAAASPSSITPVLLQHGLSR